LKSNHKEFSYSRGFGVLGVIAAAACVTANAECSPTNMMRMKASVKVGDLTMDKQRKYSNLLK
jgi:hypothetical protein